MTGRRTVGIVGLGLMGGSLARDLAAAGWRVLGTDRDLDTETRALESGAVHGPIIPAALDVLVLAVPVRAAPGWLRVLAPELGPGVVVTDLGSTKRSVVEAAGAAGLGPRFVGAHPLAGDHRSGWDASRSGLYGGALVWITPSPDATPAAVERVEALWRTVGGEPRRISPHQHDHLLARASHLPQLLATALANALAGDGVPRDTLGPGGRDMTRLAGSDPDMWADILTDNADQVAAALDDLADELTRFRRALRDLDDATLRSLLAAGGAWQRGQAETIVEGTDRL